jgi:hypothetical protein
MDIILDIGENKRGAVSVVAAASIVPTVMLLAMAIDVGMATSVKSRLDLAVDSTVLAGIRVATQEFVAGASNPAANGTTAEQQWWHATTANVPATIVSSTQTVTANTAAFYASASYSATVGSIFGGIFKVASMPMAGSAASTMTVDAYENVDLLLDNSSSMLIAADSSNISDLQALTPCFIPGELGTSSGGGSDGSGQTGDSMGGSFTSSSASSTASFVVQSGGTTIYTETCPNFGTAVAVRSGGTTTTTVGTATITTTGTDTSAGTTTLSYGGGNIQGTGYKMSNSVSNSTTTYFGTLGSGGTTLSSYYGTLSSSNGTTHFIPHQTSSICGFACHWDSSGSPHDYYALANAAGIQIRFNVVQSAVAQIIKTMETKEASSNITNQFGSGIYTFGLSLGKVYPTDSTEASTNLTAALAAAQTITSPVTGDSANTDFPDSMTSLANTLTKSGNGSAPVSNTATPSIGPIKNLFIITDGIQDYGSRAVPTYEGPMTPSSCSAIKSLGISIWVLYTTYTPIPGNSYFNNNIANYVESPPTPTSVAQSLTACASSPSQFYQASDSNGITQAMSTMLQAAAAQPARLVQ